jgi:uncharacterized protein (DUF2235 family)
MKRIVICADGTWNLRDQVDEKTGKRRPTNVTKVARAVRARSSQCVDQFVVYHDGLGTQGGLDKITGGAFGAGIENNIRELYRNILYNFEPNDEIYMFGFSRGAFTVRSLAGFMNVVGLVEKHDDYYVPELYACYERGIRPGTPEWGSAFPKSKGFRKLRIGACPPIRFIGVWDTVGALGAPGWLGKVLNRGKYSYHDVGLGPHIENAYHALAIDERRRPFKPDLWTRPAGWLGQLEQAWFAGVHSNVGGSYSPDGLANEALHWIVEKAEALGLEFDSDYLRNFLPCFNSYLADSMSLKYRAMGPYTRPLGEHAADGECVHQSAVDRSRLAECAYAPGTLAGYLAQGARVVNTARIARGTPCPPLQIQPSRGEE